MKTLVTIAIVGVIAYAVWKYAQSHKTTSIGATPALPGNEPKPDQVTGTIPEFVGIAAPNRPDQVWAAKTQSPGAVSSGDEYAPAAYDFAQEDSGILEVY